MAKFSIYMYLNRGVFVMMFIAQLFSYGASQGLTFKIGSGTGLTEITFGIKTVLFALNASEEMTG